MSKTISLTIKLNFGANEGAEIDTNDIPQSLIVESIQNLSHFLARQLVEEAEEVVPKEGVTAYLEGRLKTDRENLKKMLE